MAVRTKISLALAILCAAQSVFALEINTANEAELDGVRGFGPDTTARILKARESGQFADWADLMRRVKGIKAPTAAKLSAAGLTVNAATFNGLAPAQKAPAASPADGIPPKP